MEFGKSGNDCREFFASRPQKRHISGYHIEMTTVSTDISETQSRHFMTNLSVPSSPIHELGHQKADPTLSELSRALSKGLLCGIVFQASGLRLPSAYVSLPVLFAVDTFFSDVSKELSYDHEYAREVWEHEYNSIGEVDEYVSYATGKGLTASKARDIAMTVTSEPNVSVPYHLAFELGLIQPTSYHRKLEHSAIVGVGTALGFGASNMLFKLADLLSPRIGLAHSKYLAVSSLCIGALLPVLSFRYSHVSRVTGAKRFKLSIAAGYAVAIGLVIYFNRSGR